MALTMPRGRLAWLRRPPGFRAREAEGGELEHRKRKRETRCRSARGRRLGLGGRGAAAALHSATLRNGDRLGSSQPKVRGSFNLKAQVSTRRLGPEGSRLGLGQHAPREPAGPGHRRAPSVTAESTAHFLSNLMMMSTR